MYIDFVNLVYPKLCCLCGNTLNQIESKWCLTCDYKLPRTQHWQSQSNPVLKVLQGEWPVDLAFSLLYYKKGNQTQRLINAFKYKGEKEIGLELGSQLGKKLKNQDLQYSIDAIIPVPLHPAKLLKRGYNQAKIIAEGISTELKAPLMLNILQRETMNTTQTKKSRYERWLNVEHIFAVNNEDLIESKHVLLVDDVFTTGSTIGGCLNALFKVPSIHVSVATLACAD